MHTMKTTYFSTKELAKILSVSRQRIVQMVKEKKIRPSIAKDNMYLFSDKVVQSILIKFSK